MLGGLFSSGIVGALTGVGNIIDKFVETDEEKKVAERLLLRMRMEPDKAQVELNKIEAAHRSIFVAGWRPFIGWVGGFGLLWHFVLYDILSWVSIVAGFKGELPELSGADNLMQIVMAMLGLGAMRTYEKIKDKTK